MTRPGTEFPETRDSLLVQLRGSEDEAAWREFIALYRPVIYRIARKRGLQDADAQDVTQKILISVAGSIGTWEKRDETTRFRHWLRVVAKNAILMQLRGKPKASGGGTAVQELLEQHPESEDDVQKDIELERQREIFLRASNLVRGEVAENTWQAFELAVIERLPIEEVAARCGKSVGAAYAARGRVMNRLQRIVNQMETEES